MKKYQKAINSLKERFLFFGRESDTCTLASAFQIHMSQESGPCLSHLREAYHSRSQSPCFYSRLENIDFHLQESPASTHPFDGRFCLSVRFCLSQFLCLFQHFRNLFRVPCCGLLLKSLALGPVQMALLEYTFRVLLWSSSKDSCFGAHLERPSFVARQEGFALGPV